MVQIDEKPTKSDIEYASKRPRSDTNHDILQLFNPSSNKNLKIDKSLKTLEDEENQNCPDEYMNSSITKPETEKIDNENIHENSIDDVDIINPIENANDILKSINSEKFDVVTDFIDIKDEDCEMSMVQNSNLDKSSLETNDQNVDTNNKIDKNDFEHIFKNLHLRRIVKENHNGTIFSISFNYSKQNFGDINQQKNSMNASYVGDSNKNFTELSNTLKDNSYSNLTLSESKNSDSFYGKYSKFVSTGINTAENENVLLTISKNQANVYDNEHCGDHLDIMSNFHIENERFCCACWVKKESDSLFVTGNEFGKIRVISVAWSKELSIIDAHKGPITSVVKHPVIDSVILSLSGDKTMKILNVDSGKILSSYNYNASSACFSKDGKTICTGSSSGEIRTWLVPELSSNNNEVPMSDENSQNELVVRTFNVPNNDGNSCIFDIRSIVYGSDSAFLWRFDYIDPESKSDDKDV
ncbi:hypothetical protein AYI69_g9829 [Smittium culicis]|uniref:WD repeat-containing protein n=1 Tax=Smittium culicis TaxID=133412 RepID=A0A1R1X9Z0_9FUNG|nr:hypothetical protein AYI69_g9829 [Smittium culicis]